MQGFDGMGEGLFRDWLAMRGLGLRINERLKSPQPVRDLLATFRFDVRSSTQVARKVGYQGAIVDAVAPFLFEIEVDGFYDAHHQYVAVAGKTVHGKVSVGEALDLVGFAPESKRVVLKDIVTRGNSSYYVLDGVTKQEIHPGQVLASPGSLRPAKKFRTEVLFDERYERITQQPFQGVCRYLFHIWHVDIFGTLHLPPGKEHILHGDRFSAIIDLNEFCALEVGLQFGIGRLLGQGTVLEVIH